MRRSLIAANWKMHKTRGEGESFIKDFLPLVRDIKNIDIVICPPFTCLQTIAEGIAGSNVKLGAQNVFWENKGAYTGEVSADMLIDIGCSYVIIGHSERRSIMAETNAMINSKIQTALTAKLTPIFCVGETLAERENQKARDVVREQLEQGLQNVSLASRGLAIAYEPVWAIGTGVNASPEDAQEMSGFIRDYLATIYDRVVADTIPILYGGSVKPDNIARFMGEKDIDGALVGGASLNPLDFARIVSPGQ